MQFVVKWIDGKLGPCRAWVKGQPGLSLGQATHGSSSSDEGRILFLYSVSRKKTLGRMP
jgi:hypothetical protein